jgi:hypothetical protein
MNGDGMGALAIAILLGSVLLFVAPALILFFIAKAFAKGSRHSVAIALGSAVLGLVLGAIAVAATFFESSFAPTNRLLLQISPEMKYDWVVLLEQPGAAQTLQWRGANVPFMSKSADVIVPASGVIVVDSLNQAAGGYAQAFAANGAQSIGQAGGPAPSGSGYTVYAAFLRPDLPPSTSGAYPDLRALNEAAEFAAFLKERGVTK